MENSIGCYYSRRLSPAREISLDPRVVLTEGWYSVEEIAGRPRRWTKRRFGFRCVGREAARVKVLWCLPEESGLSHLDGTFSSPGADPAGFKVGPGWNELFFSLPESGNPVRDAVVGLSGSWTAGNDFRELALLVDSIAVGPAEVVSEPEPPLLERIIGWRRRPAPKREAEGANETLAREVLSLRKEVARLGKLLERASPLGENPRLQSEFEESFRGSRELIKERQRAYLPFFRDSWNVLDVGCGRGEFLELLRESGSEGWGVEMNPHLVGYGRGLGLRVIEDDAISYVGSLEDGTLEGVFCAQVLEHLTPSERGDLLRRIFAKLKPAGVLVAETVNPGCLSVFSDSFFMDASHVVPIPSDLLAFELAALGFDQVRVLYSSPVEEERRLAALPSLPASPDLAATLGQWRGRLNALLFGDRDYAVVARKPPAEALSALA